MDAGFSIDYFHMKNSLAVKLLRGSFFLFLALIAAFLPRLMHVPEPELPE